MKVEPGESTTPARRGADAEVVDLFTAWAAAPAEEAEALRDEIATRMMPLARNVARRFAGRGEDFDDLHQVACVGLLHAIDRFDPARGSDFVAFAVPTVMGEVRRYFRDHAWVAHVPRRLKDLTVAINKTVDGLAQRLGRSPTASELAAAIGVDTADVIEALAAGSAYQPASLDTPLDADGSTSTLADTLGGDDMELGRSETYLALRPLLDRLPARERQILILRFFKDKTQAEIAHEVGISQVHVSRLLTRTLAEIRSGLDR